MIGHAGFEINAVCGGDGVAGDQVRAMTSVDAVGCDGKKNRGRSSQAFGPALGDHWQMWGEGGEGRAPTPTVAPRSLTAEQRRAQNSPQNRPKSSWLHCNSTPALPVSIPANRAAREPGASRTAVGLVPRLRASANVSVLLRLTSPNRHSWRILLRGRLGCIVD